MESYVQQKDNFLDPLEETVQSSNFAKVLNECQVFVHRLLNKPLTKQLLSTSKETRIEETRATQLLESIARINKTEHQPDFVQSSDNRFGGLVIFKLIF